MLEELFFWVSPWQIMTVLVPVLKYPTKAAIFHSKTAATIIKPLYKAVILNG